ncbi:hypothetical protein BH10ACI3_BH10ACI3_27590 [soil metagenome]
MAESRIVWDSNKGRINQTKYGIGFDEASDVFFDPLALTVDDADHSWHEFRFISIGKTKLQKLIVVFFTETDEEIRIFSARKPTKTERLSYEEKR